MGLRTKIGAQWFLLAALLAPAAWAAKWTDQAGHEIYSTSMRVKGDQVILLIAGKERSYPFVGFSAESQARIWKSLKPDGRSALEKAVQAAQAAKPGEKPGEKSETPQQQRVVPNSADPEQPDPDTAVRQIAAAKSQRNVGRRPEDQAHEAELNAANLRNREEARAKLRVLRKQIIDAINKNRMADAIEKFQQYEELTIRAGLFNSVAPTPTTDWREQEAQQIPLLSEQDIDQLAENIEKLRNQALSDSFAGKQIEALERLLEAKEDLSRLTRLSVYSPLTAVHDRIAQLETQGKHDEAKRLYLAQQRATAVMKQRGASFGATEPFSQTLGFNPEEALLEIAREYAQIVPELAPLQEAMKSMASGNSAAGAQKAQALLDTLMQKFPPEQFSDGHPGTAFAHILLAAHAVNERNPAAFQQHAEVVREFYEFMAALYPREVYCLTRMTFKLRSLQDPRAALGRVGNELPAFIADPKVLQNFGRLFRNGMPELAKQQAEKDLESMRNKFGKHHANAVTALFQLGVACYYNGDTEAATQHLTEALEGYKRFSNTEMQQLTCNSMLARMRGEIVETSAGVIGDPLNRKAGEGMRLARSGDYGAAKRYWKKLWLASSARGQAVPGSLIELARSSANDGDYDGALVAYRRLFATPKDHWQRVYGNADLSARTELAWLSARQRDAREAVANLNEALEAQHDQLVSNFAKQSEGQLLVVIDSQRDFRDKAVSIGLEFDRSAGDIYKWLWPTRGAVLNTIVARQTQWRDADDPDVRPMYTAYLKVRREISALLLVPPGTPIDRKKDHSDERRAELDRKLRLKSLLEKELITSSPAAAAKPAGAKDSKRDSFEGLLAAVPADTAIVEYVRYNHFEQDAEKPGKAGERSSPRYLAFVFLRRQPLRCVELGPAERIEDAVDKWRLAVNERRRDADEARRVRDLVWSRVETHLGTATARVLIVPEASLQLVPWCAMPGKDDDSVLVERYQLALTPTIRSLSDHLGDKAFASSANDRLVVVGNVDYDSAEGDRTAGPKGSLAAPLQWKRLPGTKREVELARESYADQGKLMELVEHAATPDRVAGELTHARWAVLATHGFFAGPDTELVDALVTAQRFGVGGGGGMMQSTAKQNPLLFTSLVLAGANASRPIDRSGSINGDGGLLSAEAVGALRLEGLELAVLSACETGAGLTAEGEGVAGLQRAFHLAGTRQVVATLWQVNDQATVAVMRLFYDKLWREGKDAETALAEAQRFVYRHPESVSALADARGFRIAKDLRKLEQQFPEKTNRRTSTHLWAPFVLSTVALNRDAKGN